MKAWFTSDLLLIYNCLVAKYYSGDATLAQFCLSRDGEYIKSAALYQRKLVARSVENNQPYLCIRGLYATLAQFCLSRDGEYIKSAALYQRKLVARSVENNQPYLCIRGLYATLAQLVEQRIRNAQVASSILAGGSTSKSVPTWPAFRQSSGPKAGHVSCCFSFRSPFASLDWLAGLERK